MFKKTTLLALAAVAVSAFAQSDTTTTTTTQTTTTSVDSSGYPWGMNMDENTYWGQRHEVWNNLDVLSGGDRYYFTDYLNRLPTNEEMALTKALYNVRGRAMAMRHDAAMARMNSEWPTFAQAWDTTTWVSRSSTTDNAGNTVTQTTATTTTTPTTTTASNTTTSDLSAWNTSSEEFRPLRYVYEQQKPRMIDYRSAMEILGSGLSSTDQGLVNHAFMDAPERAKDIIVRLINRNLDMVDTLPLRVSYIDSFRTSAGYSNP